jgi:arginase
VKVSLIGAPTDIGASTIGCRLGPGALRLAGLPNSLRALGAEVHDCGDIVGPDNPEHEPVNGYRHLAEVIAWNQSLHDAVFAEANKGQLPIVLGGDHSLAIGSISGIVRHCREARKKVRLLWFDAHADYNTSASTPSGNMHGMPVAVLVGHGPHELVELSGEVPALKREEIRQIGLRSVDIGEKGLIADARIEVFDMRYLDEVGMRTAMSEALAGVDSNTHIHTSLDLDFLDDAIAPGVGTPVRGGPTYREAQLCMEMIADTGQLGSLDIVELNPALDIRSQTALLAVDLVESLFGKSTLLPSHRR